MNLEKRKPTGREKDQAAVELLEELRQKLYNESASLARRAAFNLSWMQEDGLEILEEALFSTASHKAKNAACYGLRNMHGRMKKAALELIRQGLDSQDKGTREACLIATQLINRPKADKALPKKAYRPQIREMRGRKKRRPISHTSPLPGRFNSDRRPPRR